MNASYTLFIPRVAACLLAVVVTAGVGAQTAPPATTVPATSPAPRPTDSRAADGTDADVEQPWMDPEAPPLLTTAAAVRALSPEQAAARRPARIEGVVTYLSVVPPLLFVHDETGGVCVSGRRPVELRTQLRVGSSVRIEGETDAGGEVAIVAARGRDPLKIEVLGEGVPPEPRSAEVGQLSTAALHADLVEVEGVVRWARVESLGSGGREALVLGLSQGNNRAEAAVLGRLAGAEPPEHLVGAIVRVRGVFCAATPDRQESASMRLLMRSMRDVRVRRPAVAQEYLPPVMIDSLRDYGPERGTRARVRGVVTLAVAGKGMFVQDAAGGAWVESAPTGADAPLPAPRPGDALDVVGFPGQRGWAPTLEDAVWATDGRGALPSAPLVAAERALGGGLDGQVIRVEAIVLTVSRLAEGMTLALRSGDRVFLARFVGPAAGGDAAELGRPTPGADPARPPVLEGSWVRVTGVCVNGRAADALEPGAAVGAAAPLAGGSSQPVSFHLLLGSPDAVEVIKAPPWWTLRRVLAVSGVLAAAAVAALAWVAALRRRVARQTGLIREHVARETLYEERVRIARDLHDSLEQDLLGITLQLNATEKLLGRPEQARQSLQLAAAMVRRSKAETHRAVWDLRDLRRGADGRHGLVEALREAVAGLRPARAGSGNGAGTRDGAGDNGETAEGHDAPAPAGPSIDVRVTGQPSPLPPQAENHLLRVAMEAVTNAVKHAGASRIGVELEFEEHAVRLAVNDDGRGFDTQRLPPPSSGHFGVFGMRERAEKLDAEFHIHSRPGGGTEVRLEVPLNGKVVGKD